MSIYTKGVSFPNRNQLYPLITLHVQCGLCVHVCLFTQKDVSFPNRNQLYPLITLHVQCGLCVHVCLFIQKDVSFPNRNQLYPLFILHVQCSLCVQYVYLHKRTYHFQIEINYILYSSCTSNVVCVYSMSIYTKGVSFPNRNQLYPLIILHVPCSLCVQYVYLHKRTYHFQIEINYILLSSCTSNVVCVYTMSIYTKGVSFPNRNQLYPLIILHVQCGLCVQYVYLHKRAYHSQIEIKYILIILHGVQL